MLNVLQNMQIDWSSPPAGVSVTSGDSITINYGGSDTVELLPDQVTTLVFVNFYNTKGPLSHSDKMALNRLCVPLLFKQPFIHSFYADSLSKWKRKSVNIQGPRVRLDRYYPTFGLS